MTKPQTIKSKRVCPECGGREWYPVSMADGYIAVKLFTAVVDKHFYGIAAVDECAACGLVVSG